MAGAALMKKQSQICAVPGRAKAGRDVGGLGCSMPKASAPTEQSPGGRRCTSSVEGSDVDADLSLDVSVVCLMIEVYCEALVAQDIAVSGAHRDHLFSAGSSHCSLFDAFDSSWLPLTPSAPL